MEVSTKIIANGATPSFLNYNGFPNSICASINEVVIHGIPSRNIKLKNGDIISHVKCGEQKVVGWKESWESCRLVRGKGGVLLEFILLAVRWIGEIRSRMQREFPSQN